MPRIPLIIFLYSFIIVSPAWADSSSLPLLIAAQKGDTAEVLCLLDEGHDVNFHINNDYTALMFASDMGYSETVKLLLDRGAKVKIKDQKGAFN